jgi:DNA-binding Xre family transcriptional regulator
MNSRRHRGSDLRDFLQEEGILEEVEARALKRAIALQLDALRKSQTISKSALAARMKTSRAAIDRLLDASNPSVTLLTLQKAARVFKRKLKVELVEA